MPSLTVSKNQLVIMLGDLHRPKSAEGRFETELYKITKANPPSGNTPLGRASLNDDSVPGEHECELRRGRKIEHEHRLECAHDPRSRVEG